MLETIKQYQFLLGALSGSVAAYLLGSLVTWLRRDRRVLGYTVSSRIISSGGVTDLSIRYKGRDTSALHSHVVTATNIGNRALIEFPIRIGCRDDGIIYSPVVVGPPGESFAIKQESHDSFVVQCGLLNVRESLDIEFTVLEAKEIGVDVTVRQENLSVQEIVPQVLASHFRTAMETAYMQDIIRAAVVVRDSANRRGIFSRRNRID